MSTSIRAAVAGDAAEIARLLTILGHATERTDVAERWAAWAAEGNSALVALGSHDSRLAAVITMHRMRVLHRPDPVGRITALVVDIPLRGQGIGSTLIAAAERSLRSAGCALLEITSNRRLTDAHAFYERLGYRYTSLRFARDLTLSPVAVEEVRTTTA